MKKLLFISELGNKVSYSYVTKSLKNIIEKRFDVYYFCVRNLGDTCIKELENDNYDMNKVFFIKEELLIFNNKYIQNENYKNNVAGGIVQLEEIISIVDPDIIITLGDTELVKTQCLKINNLDYKGVLIPYITIDTTLAKKEWFDYKKDFMLTVSQHSKSILNGYGYKNIEVLNHITNEQEFYKLDFKAKLEARNNIFKTNKYDDYFIVGSLNCNSYRKKWDILIKSFCIFAKDKEKDKCLLLLKTKPFNKTKDLIYGGYNMPYLINYYANMYGINHDNFKIFDEHLDNNGLNQFYNICDVFLNTTSGEGWGLTNIEAALVKTPLIIPKNTSLIEIFGDQYEGYLEGKLYSSHIARTEHYINNENNKIDNLFCFTAVFYDDYKYNKIEYLDQIVNFDDIPIIFIGSEVYENENIYKSFKNYSDFLDFYKENNDLPKYFKVLASVDFDLINELCFLFKKDAFFTKKNKYRIIHISKKTVENSCSSETNPLVHIVSASKTADLLDRYFKDESIRNISSNYVYNRVKGKYNYENIENQFNNIMDQWNL